MLIRIPHFLDARGHISLFGRWSDSPRSRFFGTGDILWGRHLASLSIVTIFFVICKYGIDTVNIDMIKPDLVNVNLMPQICKTNCTKTIGFFVYMYKFLQEDENLTVAKEWQQKRENLFWVLRGASFKETGKRNCQPFWNQSHS